MTLPISGSIALSQVDVELGNSATGQIQLGSSAVRSLLGVPSGQISLSAGYGKKTPTQYTAEILIVAGGGGGAPTIYGGGGGGGGGILFHPGLILVPNTTFLATVGDGGQTWNVGNDSSFGPSLVAKGGGASNTSQNAATRIGGSGGGASHMNPAGAASASNQTSMNGATGYGNNGGPSQYYNPYYNGSGGGAGGAGSAGGAGGLGRAFTTSGSSVYYSGGGGQCNNNGAVTAGGLGGGGTAGNGTANTGGGGGGGYNADSESIGGSGIIIVKYLGAQRGSGGVVTSVGGYTIHTFTSGAQTFTA